MKIFNFLLKSMLAVAMLLAVACGGNKTAAINYDKLTYPQLMEQAGAEQIADTMEQLKEMLYE